MLKINKPLRLCKSSSSLSCKVFICVFHISLFCLFAYTGFNSWIPQQTILVLRKFQQLPTSQQTDSCVLLRRSNLISDQKAINHSSSHLIFILLSTSVYFSYLINCCYLKFFSVHMLYNTCCYIANALLHTFDTGVR